MTVSTTASTNESTNATAATAESVITQNVTEVFHEIGALQHELKAKRPNQRIALVPTMGNLHAGHLALVKLAKAHADVVVVSVFVNPTQFGEGEDFDSYPRTLEQDVAQVTQVGADYVFAPSVEAMYPTLPPSTFIGVGEIADQLCGKSRPGHFDGVGIAVCKLFNIVQPDVAIFGQKDYQQLAIIEQLVRDLSYSIEIIGAPIVRAADGLALSSRNQYLSDEQRDIAPQLNQSIESLAAKLSRGEHVVVGMDALIKETISELNTHGFQVDYLQIKTPSLTDSTDSDKQLVILVAAWLGKARLLDNRVVDVAV